MLKYSKTGHTNSPKIPFVTLNKKKELVFHKPSGYLQLPLREKLSLVALVEKTIMKHTTKRRKKQQKEVARKIFLKMKNISEEFNSKFLVVNLKSNIEEYDNFFEKNNINSAINIFM